MSTLQPGDRPFLIVFQRGTAVVGGLGTEPAAGWTEFARAWASVRFGTSAERRAAAADEASAVATFRVPSTIATRGVTVRDRIVFQDTPWKIHGSVPIDLNDEIEFAATASKG